MNIVAVSTDPEYITVEATEGGGIDLTLESARMQVTTGIEGNVGSGRATGSIQLHLLPADVEVITSRLAEIVTGLGFSVERAQQQHSLDVDRYADGSPVPDEPTRNLHPGPNPADEA